MILERFFKNVLLRHIENFDSRKSIAGRPRTLNNNEALDALFKLCRTGMQWREVEASVSYATVFRRAQQWIRSNLLSEAYKDVLRVYKRHHPVQHYCVVSSYVKNRFGGRHSTSGRITPIEEGRPSNSR